MTAATNAADRALVERLRAKHKVFPTIGGGNTNGESYVIDDGFRLINPDGLEAAARLEALATAQSEVEALAGYRAAVSFIAADAWDGCSDCIEILRAARAADWANDQAANPNETAKHLARIRQYAALTTSTGYAK